MQFRTSQNGRRVQCLAAVYDKESKRTRQKLVWTIDHYAPHEQRPMPEALAAGSPAQREVWAAEIVKHLDERDERGRQNKIRSGIHLVDNIMSAIVQDLDSKTPTLTDDDRQRISALVRGWVDALHIDMSPKKVNAPRPAPASIRAFGADLVEQARTLRRSGVSIGAIVKQMSAEGHTVSKSWVHKRTSENL